MALALVGDDHFGIKASMALEIPYRSMADLVEDESYISVVSTVEQREEMRDLLAGHEEVAVMVCAEDCKALLKLVSEETLVFAGIPGKDLFEAVLANPKRRTDYMAAERSKIATARSIENHILQHDGGGRA